MEGKDIIKLIVSLLIAVFFWGVTIGIIINGIGYKRYINNSLSDIRQRVSVVESF